MGKLFLGMGILFLIIGFIFITPLWKYCKENENHPQKIVDESTTKKLRKKLIVFAICMILSCILDVIGTIIYIIK